MQADAGGEPLLSCRLEGLLYNVALFRTLETLEFKIHGKGRERDGHITYLDKLKGRQLPLTLSYSPCI